MNKDKYVLINDGIEIKFRVDLSWNAILKQWHGVPRSYYEKDGRTYTDNLTPEAFKFGRKRTVIKFCNRKIKGYIKDEKRKATQARLLEERRILAQSRNIELHFINGKLTDKV